MWVYADRVFLFGIHTHGRWLLCYMQQSPNIMVANGETVRWKIPVVMLRTGILVLLFSCAHCVTLSIHHCCKHLTPDAPWCKLHPTCWWGRPGCW